jgi:hypothetical protein
MPHILKRSDGLISVLFSAPGSNAAEEANKVAVANEWEYLGEYELPISRYFRDCWAWNSDTSAVVVDLNLALAQKMAEIRTERNKRLIASDGEMARASEVGTEEEVTTLKVYRQTLRDVPEVVEAVLSQLTDADALESFEVSWPVL